MAVMFSSREDKALAYRRGVKVLKSGARLKRFCASDRLFKYNK